ncbi:MAG: helix-turn-helix transcriptional regulator [Verrucomicrobia bacterium]|nr:helix-turn-helix transcriptional regulator [Verrucomicrobiota bacterium]
MAKRGNRSGVPAPADISDEALELIAARFRVLGEPSRPKLLRALEAGELSVSALIVATGLTQANASRHLQTLTQAGILGRRRDGTKVLYHIADPGIFRLCELVCGSLQTQLERHASAFAAN